MAASGAGRGKWLTAILFGLCGVLSYCVVWLWENSSIAMWIAGLPFGVFSAWLFVRPLKIAPAIAILDGLVWVASVKTAAFLIGDHGWNSYAGMAVAGLMGGWGVAASTGVSCSALRSVRSLAAVAAAGCIAALPFGYWEPRNSDTPGANLLGMLCFAMWQAATGTSLSRLCTETSEAPPLPATAD